MERIDTSSISKEFDHHLTYAGERVLFSGKFGVGKTTFLREHFDDHQSYLAIHLFPVNYSVASNEDIFQLIKFDILFELLKPEYELEFDKIEFGNLLSAFYFTRKNFMEILAAFLATLPKVGKQTSGIVSSINKWTKDFREFKADVETDELKEVTAFLESFRAETGSIYEHDLHTELIENFINQIKKSTEKKIILVIDDLERVDPEHLFRLLNVFSAQVDSPVDGNKFGFDKVVFVQDLENTTRIFYNRYGAETDFSGYIDKFFSKEIFRFSSGEYIKQKIRWIFDNLRFPDENPDQKRTFDLLISEGSYIHNAAVYLLESMVLSGSLNLRKVINKVESYYLPPFYELSLLEGLIIKNWQVPTLIAIDLLNSFFESENAFINAIGRTDFMRGKKSGSRVTKTRKNIGVNMMFLNDHAKHHMMQFGEMHKNEYENGSHFEYSFKWDSSYTAYQVKLHSISGEFDIKALLTHTVKLIRDRKT